MQTRFKKSLEPSVNPRADGPRRKALQAAGSLVIGFSGGSCSTVLLDLVAKTYFAPRRPASETVQGGKAHPRNAERRVWNAKPAVCYVEVCGAFPQVRSTCILVLENRRLIFVGQRPDEGNPGCHRKVPWWIL